MSNHCKSLQGISRGLVISSETPTCWQPLGSLDNSPSFSPTFYSLLQGKWRHNYSDWICFTVPWIPFYRSQLGLSKCSFCKVWSLQGMVQDGASTKNFETKMLDKDRWRILRNTSCKLFTKNKMRYSWTWQSRNLMQPNIIPIDMIYTCNESYMF